MALLWGSALNRFAQSPVEIIWWHSMSGALGQWVTALAADFNTQQKDFRVVPHVVQIFEVGTAMMMASKGLVVPCKK